MARFVRPASRARGDPHIAQEGTSAIDGWTTQHPGYQVSQRKAEAGRAGLWLAQNRRRPAEATPPGRGNWSTESSPSRRPRTTWCEACASATTGTRGTQAFLTSKMADQWQGTNKSTRKPKAQTSTPPRQMNAPEPTSQSQRNSSGRTRASPCQFGHGRPCWNPVPSIKSSCMRLANCLQPGCFGRLHVGRFESRRRLYSGVEV